MLRRHLPRNKAASRAGLTAAGKLTIYVMTKHAIGLSRRCASEAEAERVCWRVDVREANAD